MFGKICFLIINKKRGNIPSRGTWQGHGRKGGVWLARECIGSELKSRRPMTWRGRSLISSVEKLELNPKGNKEPLKSLHFITFTPV